MENLFGRLKAQGDTLQSSNMTRLKETPRTGIYEDLGSSFKPSGPRAKIEEQTRSIGGRSQPVSDFESGSEDEMDCLSQSTQADETKVVTKEKATTTEKLSDYHPSTLERKSMLLKTMKFSKNKPAKTETTRSAACPRSSPRKSRLQISREDEQLDERNVARLRKSFNTVPRSRPKSEASPKPPKGIIALRERGVGKKTLSTIPLPSPLSSQKNTRGRDFGRDSLSSTDSLNQSSSSSNGTSPPSHSRPSSLTSSSTPAPRLPNKFPTFSPLGSPATKPNVTAAKGFPRLSPLLSDRKAFKKRGKEGKRKASSGGPRPFPMLTQDFSSIGSKPPAGDSDVHNSSPEGPSRKRKYKRDGNFATLGRTDSYEEEDSLFISPTIDPKTLCPYCDAPLPDSPTPLLRRLLESTAGKSRSDPRPTNPLGRKAPLATFISVCRRHQFESQILPEAEAKGWPKAIDWERLSGRVERMGADLRNIIDDPGDKDADELPEHISLASGPRTQCVFWRDVITIVKTRGLRAVADVRGQFLDFDKTQPGYYGELGSVIIQHTLLNMFPPESLDPALFLPLTANEFIPRILVPEVALRLIMEDRQLKGPKGKDVALQVLRDSASYGVAMFSEDGWEGPKGTQAGVGDRIVMERAKKRRQEIEGEEIEGLVGVLQSSDTDGTSGKDKRWRDTRKAGGFEFLGRDPYDKQPRPSRNLSRKKGASATDPGSDGDNMVSDIPTAEPLAQSRPRRSVKTVDYTDISSDDDEPPSRDRVCTKRSTKISRSPSTSTLSPIQSGSKRKPIPLSDMDMCSSNSSRNLVASRQRDMPSRKTKLSKTKDQHDGGAIVDVTTPVATRRTQTTEEDDVDPTPRPPRKPEPSLPQESILTRARERKKPQDAKRPQKGKTKSSSKSKPTNWLHNLRARTSGDSSDSEKTPVVEPRKRVKGPNSWILSESSSQEGLV